MIGFLNIDKPANISSFHVIKDLRKILRIKQLGHAGTLDPLATGVLPVAVNKATRLIEYLDHKKAYICKCEFGKVSDTYDNEGKVEIFSDKLISREEAAIAIKKFEGDSEQVPPAYSAVHYNGKRLYELARKGEIPDDIKKRKITVYKAELLRFDYERQEAKFLIECSGGTYIRSIVNDLGLSLQAGAVMTFLQRTYAAGFSIKNSIKPEELNNINNLSDYLINPLDVIPYKRKELTESEFNAVIHGREIYTKGDFVDERVILTQKRKIIAVGCHSAGIIKIEKVFA